MTMPSRWALIAANTGRLQMMWIAHVVERLAKPFYSTTKTIVPGFTLEKTTGTVSLGPRMQAWEAG